MPSRTDMTSAERGQPRDELHALLAVAQKLYSERHLATLLDLISARGRPTHASGPREHLPA
jgi:hypothetical protein